MRSKRKAISAILTVLLALTMVFAMSITAFAATVTNNGPDGHSYTAYQILAGTKADGKLGVTGWGSGIDVTTENDNFLTALKATDSPVKDDFANVTDAAGFAEQMGKFTDLAKAKSVAQIAYKYKKEGTTIASDKTSEVDLAEGYYLIVDNYEGEKNSALLQITDEITIANKTDAPTVEKKVQENTKATDAAEYGERYNDVADYSIGENVPFKLIGKVPDTTNYEKYPVYTFTDTLGTGFTAPESKDVKVFYSTDKAAVDGTAGNIDLSEYFGVNVTDNIITVSLKQGVDLKTVEEVDKKIAKGGFIIVTYSAKLNEKAVIAPSGNVNAVTLKYTNEPNLEKEGVPTTNTTQPDEVIVFTYKLDVNKIDATSKDRLPNAKFKLYKQESGVDKYAIVDTEETSETKGKITGWTEKLEDATELVSDGDGLFSAAGLDQGTYYLKETKAPDGYNKLKEDIEFTITATTNHVQNWDGTKTEDYVKKELLTALTIQVKGHEAKSGTLNNGTVQIDVENNQGSILPSTGGMGTTIFYIVGAVLVLGGAAVLMFRKKNY